MAGDLELQFERDILALIEGRISLSEFRALFIPVSWNIESSGNPRAISLAYTIDGILAEASSGHWTDRQIRDELSKSVRCASLPDH